jgi:hypothetical protein
MNSWARPARRAGISGFNPAHESVNSGGDWQPAQRLLDRRLYSHADSVLAFRQLPKHNPHAFYALLARQRVLTKSYLNLPPPQRRLGPIRQHKKGVKSASRSVTDDARPNRAIRLNHMCRKSHQVAIWTRQ